MRVKITAGANVYLIAGESHAQADGNYQGRLLNEINLNSALSAIGTTPVTLDLSIRNDDAYILRSINLWAASVEITAEGGQKWIGKITAYDNDADGVLRAIITELAAPELEIQFPDEVARLVTVDENFHTSAVNVTLPLVIGGTVAAPHLIKGILIDKTAGIYLLCVGEIHQVVKVYRGTEELSTGFTAYTGTAGQDDYPGFAYVAIDEAHRLNDDGSYVEISAEIIGLKLGPSTIEECRNGARFLQYLLTTEATGVNGWGLGIAESDIDTTSFTTAISRIDAAGLKLDGVFYFRQVAQSWIDQICQAIRGSYSIGDDGKRRLFVNASGSSVKTYTDNNMRVLRDGKGAYTGRVYNKGKLDYGYNPTTGQFMQSAQYENATSIAAIGEQEFYGQSYLIKDAATAQAILEYNCKKSLIGADKVLFETDELAENCRVGDIITITHLAKSLVDDWQITRLEVGDYIHTIEAERYSTDIFTVGTPGTVIDWVADSPIISSITPGAASGLTLSSEIRPGADGTNIVVLSGTFTQPASAYLAASIEYGEDAEPTTWNSLGMVQGNAFEIVPVKPAQVYAVRIRMISSTGKSDYVTATITTQGDAVPPGQPSISATSYLKNISVIIALGTVPSDLAGFQIFRHTSNNSAAATLITSVSSKDGRAEYHEVYQGDYGDTLYYWAKAFDTWGNVGEFSSAAGPLTISAIEGADIVDAALNRSELFQAGVVDAAAISAAALKQAGGAVAAWSAQNCTTASIAEAGGVIDVSGNGNHGTAVGVEVVETDMGMAFSFNNAGDYIAIPATTFADEGSISCWMRGEGTGTWRDIASRLGGGHHHIIINSEDEIGFYSSALNFVGSGIILSDNELYHIAVVFKNGEYWKLYVNGTLRTTLDSFFNTFDNPLGMFGNYLTSGGRNFNGIIAQPRIFNRALAANEVKSLYMFPGDVAFARVTADFMAANSVVAESIVSGAVTTPKLAAGSVTMEKLLVGAPGAALNDDPNFQDTSSWENAPGFGNGSLQSVNDGIVGNKVLRTTDSWAFYMTTRPVPIDPSKQYRISCYYRAINTASSIFPFFVPYTTGAEEPTAVFSYESISSSTNWQRYGRIVTFASGVKWCKIGLHQNSVSTATEIQDLRLEEVLPATLIQDGAIITDKLASNAVTAVKISAGAVETAKLAAGSVVADKIGASAITAEKINVSALKAPAGAIAEWSAKGSTTASIALSGGIKDTSGNGRHATAVGGVAVVGSDKGIAFSLDGSDDHIALADSSYLAFGTGDFAFSIWGNPDTVSDLDTLLEIGSYPTGLLFRPSTTGIELYIAGVLIYGPDYVRAAGTWAHYVLTRLSGVVYLYVNGTLIASAAAAQSIATGGVGARIGSSVHIADQRWDGLLFAPKLYSRGLTAAEVKTLYMLGTDSESGTITADRVVTGQIKSLNYSTTAGSMIDLDAGDVKMGGSTAPRFSFTNSTNTGVFAGFTFNATDLTAGSGSAAIGFSTDTAKSFIWAGSETSTTAPFRVTRAGAMTAGYITLSGSQIECDLASAKYFYLSGMAGGDYAFYPGLYVKSYYSAGNPTIVDIGVDDNSSISTQLRTGDTNDKAPIISSVSVSAYYGVNTNGRIYAAGGFYPASDENVKSDIEDVSVLSSLKTIRVKKYYLDETKLKRRKMEREIERNIKEKNAVIPDNPIDIVEPEIPDYNPCRSIGVIAQDFNKAFGIGRNDETTYNLTDGIGVALRAIQELAEIVDDQAAEIAELRAALKLPEKQKKQADSIEFTAEEIERAADNHVKAAYENIMQELKK